MSLPSFSVKNSVLVNVIMILIVAMGTFSLLTLPRELFPQIRLNRVIVSVTYPGASPEEVEKLITKPIEDEIKDVDKIDLYLSTSTEGQAQISVVFQQITEDEFRRLYQDLRQEVDKVDLPDEAEDPLFFSLESSTWLPMATMAVSGPLPEKRLKEIAEELQDEIEGIRGVDDVALAGDREREVWVEVDPYRLYRHNLTLEQVAVALSRQNVSLPSGDLALGDYEYMVRTLEEFESLEDIADVVIKEDEVGNHVRLGDVAQVRDTFEEALTISRLNGEPSISINVYKAPSGNTLELVEQFRQIAQEKMLTLPPGVKVSVVGDNSARIQSAIERLVSNGLFGGLLVLVLLLGFLGWRNALLVFWGIPITFLLTFVFIELYGESLNESSLFALVLVLGMVVDDAIVVVENISRYLNRGLSPLAAAKKGAEEVMWPVISSSLTTVAAFLPLMLLPGTVGEFMRVIPVVVCMALAASLFESLVILPSHVADLGRTDPHRHHSALNRTIRRTAAAYRRMMSPLLRRRWIFLPIIVLLLASTALVIPLVGVDLYEDDELPTIFIRVWMPEGSRIETTDQVVRQFEEIAMQLPDEELRNVVTQIGVLDSDTARLTGKDVAQVLVNLHERNERPRPIAEIVDQLRARSAGIVGYRRLEIKAPATGPPVGNPVEVKVKGRYFEDLQVIAGRLKDYLNTLSGVHSVQDDFERGKNEVRVSIDESRTHTLGIDARDVARQIKYAFDGIPATIYRDGDEELDVVVKFKPEFRSQIQDLDNLRIPTPSGGLVPFDSVASFSIERGWADVQRFEGERAITVSADVDPAVTSAVAVNNRLKEHFVDIGKEYPGYRLDFRGEFQEFQETFNDVTRLFLIGLILMYLILAAQFHSYLQPLLIMFAIPFAFAGAMFCLLVNDYRFSINIMFGMVALSGVAVNDSIVLIAFINDARARGASRFRAVLTGAKRRLRPILLTTVTTIFGLLPMALGVGGRSVTWVPLAATIVWGLGLATFLILLVMPPLYIALDDVRRLFSGGRRPAFRGRRRSRRLRPPRERREPSPESGEAAGPVLTYKT
ncbi:MAG TPA: efflux RND transporter permease subunit [Acidobacteriota bacterium]|nr:efflux RND transporter permease subunit [Acidobacteriota bacterium]